MTTVPSVNYAKDVQNSFNVYSRNIDGTLGLIRVNGADDHKEAIMQVKELLVQGGDCLTNKAVLAVIVGGTQGE